MSYKQFIVDSQIWSYTGRFSTAFERFVKKMNMKSLENIIVKELKINSKSDVFCKVKCPHCQNVSWKRSDPILKPTFTGMCRSCLCISRKGINNPLHNPNKITFDGYREYSLFELNETDRQLILPMAAKKGKNSLYILEHRLVMAKHLGRPLLSKEIVHHKNGNRLDNRLENLELLTTQTHHSGHGDYYYQKWQEAENKLKTLKQK